MLVLHNLVQLVKFQFKLKAFFLFPISLLLQLLFPSLSVCSQTPLPGCSGCGEGGVIVWGHWENTCHSDGSQVFTPVNHSMSVAFCLSLTNVSTQYFSEALFLDKIPPCSAEAQSGEHLYVSLFFVSQDVICLYIVCEQIFEQIFSFSAPSKAWLSDEFNWSSKKVSFH